MDKYKSHLKNKRPTAQSSYKENARAARAVLRREEQKAERARAHFRSRVVHTPIYTNRENVSVVRNNENKNLVPNKANKVTKKEQVEVAKQRYRDMLAWKEKRKKLVAAEKKTRTHVFHAGVYKPDKTKYLTSDVEDEMQESGVSCLCRSTVKSVRKDRSTPSMSCKKTPAWKPQANKLLKFRTGVTPNITSNKTAVISRHKKNSDLGITPLPVTPGISGTKNETLRTKKFSFAPAEFRFNAPPNVKAFDFTKESNVRLSYRTALKDLNINSSAKLKQKQQKKTLKNDSDLHKGKKNSNRNFIDVVSTKLCVNSPSPKNMSLNVSPNHKNSALADSKATKDDEISVIDGEVEKIDEFTNELPSIEVVTEELEADPVKYESKPKKRGKFYDTPVSTRLRPRTPCSRSTRRSHSVHCDRLSLGSISATPLQSSVKRRKSKKINASNIQTTENDSPKILKEKKDSPKTYETEIDSPKINMVRFDQSKQEVRTHSPVAPVETLSKSILKKPTENFKSPMYEDSQMNDCETSSSPLLERRSSRTVSSRRKRKPMTVLERMFNSKPTWGSPVPFVLDCSPDEDEDKENRSDSNSIPSPLLRPTLREEFDCLSPTDVWGETEKEMGDAPPEEDSERLVANDDVDEPLLKKKKKGRTKRLSRTPVKKSTRLSKPRKKVSLLPGLPSSPPVNLLGFIPEHEAITEDLISFNSPQIQSKESAPRVGLLPGLSPTVRIPAALSRIEVGHLHEDLISWTDSPAGKKDNKRKSALATPLRRSARIGTTY